MWPGTSGSSPSSDRSAEGGSQGQRPGASKRARLARSRSRLLQELGLEEDSPAVDLAVDLVVAGTGGLGHLAEFYERLQRTHSERMTELGLA